MQIPTPYKRIARLQLTMIRHAFAGVAASGLVLTSPMVTAQEAIAVPAVVSESGVSPIPVIAPTIVDAATTAPAATPSPTSQASTPVVAEAQVSVVGVPVVPVPVAVASVPEPEPQAVMTERTVIDLGDLPDRVTFTFQEAPWGEVLREFADWSGLTLDMTDTPPGYFSYFDSRPHSPTEAIDILNGYLLPRGYVVLRRDQFLVALRTTNEMLSNLIPTVTLDEFAQRGENELVKIVMPVEELSPEAAAEEIRGLLGPFGAATPLESSKSILLQGFGSGLRQAMSTLQQSRPLVTDDKLDFRSFTLVHLPVADAEAQIRKLFGLASPSAPANVSGARYELDRASYYRDRESRDSRDKSRDTAAPPIPLLKQVAMNMQVSSLERTNNLLVTATPEGLQLVEEILKSIDVAADGKTTDWKHENEPELRVYRVSSADEGEVAKTLDVLMPGVVVNEDRRQDSLHLFGTPKQHEEAERLIRKLDDGAGGDAVVEVIPLKRSNPTAAATLLTGMFSNVDRDERPMIQAEVATRSLVVRGTQSQVDQVRAALVKFGEPAESNLTASIASNPRFRRIVVGGRSAEAIAGAAERILSTDDEFRGSIRVVVPGQAKSDAKTQSNQEAATEKPLLDTTQSDLTHQDAFQTVALRDISNSQFVSKTTPIVTASKDAAKPTSARASVSIEVQGDELLVYSGDPDSLDAVEAMIRELVSQLPNHTRWTVFYLKVSEAENASLKLSQLMAEDLYPALPGLAMSEIEVPPLKIIADKRTNAIFVSGTDQQVSQAEGFLEYIDAADVPGSFLRREPHAIQVEYADVDQIAVLLSSLYKDYLVDPVAERIKAEQERTRSTTTKTTIDPKDLPGIRLTLAVDRKTGELLVACNDQLFQEIEAVVRQRDMAARDSQPTIEFVHVSGDLPDNIVELLGGISPKITAEAILPELESRTKPKATSTKTPTRSTSRK